MLTWGDTKPTLERVLPAVAAVTARLGGVLVGGTALAWQLEHRASFDLDVQMPGEFDEQAVAAHLGDRGRSFELLMARPSVLVGRMDGVLVGRMDGVLVGRMDGVKVEVWRSSAPPEQIEDGPTVLGMPLASLPDLFALKLQTVRSRAQMRDYVDIAALTEVMGMENGIRAYAMRFGHFLIYDDLYDVFSVLTPPPGDLPPDPPFEGIRDRVLETVHLAAEAALEWLTEHNRVVGSPGDEPGSPRSSRA